MASMKILLKNYVQDGIKWELFHPSAEIIMSNKLVVNNLTLWVKIY